MRVIIDTGVFISAAIKTQTIPNLAVYRAAQFGVLPKSNATEAELLEVIDRPFLARLIAPEARAHVLDLMARSELVSITESIAACRDAKDDKFLELAVNGNADMIVTGDADLLMLNPFRGVLIVPPATFVQGSGRVP
jgi:putative PIN family toxin of toxin-antitoxin system